MEIQAVLFDRNMWTTAQARAWLRKHKLKPFKQVHMSQQYMRYRISEPDPRGKYATRILAPGLRIILVKRAH